MPKEPDLFFYTNARLAGRTALLAGPFIDEAAALHVMDAIAPAAIKDHPEAEFATFGVLSVKSHIGYGVYNYVLRGSGIPILEMPNGPPPFITH